MTPPLAFGLYLGQIANCNNGNDLVLLTDDAGNILVDDGGNELTEG